MEWKPVYQLGVVFHSGVYRAFCVVGDFCSLTGSSLFNMVEHFKILWCSTEPTIYHGPGISPIRTSLLDPSVEILPSQKRFSPTCLGKWNYS